MKYALSYVGTVGLLAAFYAVTYHPPGRTAALPVREPGMTPSKPQAFESAPDAAVVDREEKRRMNQVAAEAAHG